MQNSMSSNGTLESDTASTKHCLKVSVCASFSLRNDRISTKQGSNPEKLLPHLRFRTRIHTPAFPWRPKPPCLNVPPLYNPRRPIVPGIDSPGRSMKPPRTGTVRLSALLLSLSVLMSHSLGSLTAADWPMLGRDVRRSHSSPDDVAPPYRRAWVQYLHEFGVSPFAQPVIADRKIILGLLNGNVRLYFP